MKPETKVIAMRYAHKMVIQAMMKKYRAWGCVSFRRSIPDQYNELDAVLEALREEHKKRGLR